MRIAFIQLGRVGDMILCTPAFSAIKSKFPDAELYVIAGAGNYSVLDNNPYIDKVIPYRKSLSGIFSILSFLLFNKFDYWIDAKDHKSGDSQLLAKLARAKVKIGYNHNSNTPFHHSVPSNIQNKDLHFTERIFNALKFLGISSPEIIPKPELFISDELSHKAKYFYSSLSRKQNLLINLSATSETRIYSAENWTKVIAAIDINKYNIILSFMPSEQRIAQDLKQIFPTIIFANSHSIAEFIALIKHCDVLISPDTSAVHIAAAFEKRLIALFNDYPDNYAKFRTVNPNATIIMPSGTTNTNQIPPELIINEIEKTINQSKG